MSTVLQRTGSPCSPDQLSEVRRLSVCTPPTGCTGFVRASPAPETLPSILHTVPPANFIGKLEALPSELLQLIVAHLSSCTLKSVALVSTTLNRHATDILWQNVCLADQWKLHLNEQTNQLWGDRGRGESDEHDDTPIVQKLYILATYVWIHRETFFLTYTGTQLLPPKSKSSPIAAISQPQTSSPNYRACTSTLRTSPKMHVSTSSSNSLYEIWSMYIL